MTTHVSNNQIVHCHYKGLVLDWPKMTVCGVWYIRESDRWPPDLPRYHVTTEPVDCMACLVKMVVDLK